MFDLIARVVIRRGWLIIVAWAAAAAALQCFAPPWEQVSRDDNVRFFPAGFPSVVGQELLERGFPKDASSSQVVFIHERRGGDLTEADLAYVDTFESDFYRFAARELGIDLKKMETHNTPVVGPRLRGVSRGADGKVNGAAVLTIVSLRGTYLAKSTRLAIDKVLEYMAALPPTPAGMTRGVTGSAVVGHDMNTASVESIHNTTSATIVLVVVILLVVYRSPLLALTPLLTIALSVKVSLWAISLLTVVPGLEFQIIDITNIFVIVVLFGAGTDYCLFLIARYREELIRGRPRERALRESIRQVGGALVASAGTVIVGLGMLWFSTFAKIQYTGPAIALSLAIGLVASLTLAPVMLYWLRSAIFWPFKQPRHEGPAGEPEGQEQMPLSRFWTGAANLVVRRPGAILLVCLLALAPLAWIGSRTRSNYSQLADLDADRPSVVGAKLIQNYFAVGELSPTGLLIEHPRLNFRDPAGRDAIEALSRQLSALEGVSEVRSVSRPLGKPPKPAERKTFLDRQLERLVRGSVDRRYVSTFPDSAVANHITRVDVIFATDPFSETTLSALGDVLATVRRAGMPGGPLAGIARFGATGSTASVDDLRRVTTADERRMYVLVTVGVYLILVVLLRRPWISLYLIATVVLGYLASLGVTELVFKALHHGPDPWVGLDWKVGFFLFVILVAVGEDYNIFLMSRVIEEEEKHGLTEGTRLAVAHTGGIISSCGLIMAGTFGSMLTGSLTALRELGFALGLGVLLDTFLVRPILVPAFIVLVERHLPSRRGPSRLPHTTDAPSTNGDGHSHAGPRREPHVAGQPDEKHDVTLGAGALPDGPLARFRHRRPD